MKIAIFQANIFGGALRLSYEMARVLAARGHELHLFTYRLNRDIFDLYNLSTSASGASPDLQKFAHLHDLPDPRQRYLFPLWSHWPWRVQRLVTKLARINDLRAFQYSAVKSAQLIDQAGCDVMLAHICQFTNAPMLLGELETPACWYCHEPSRNLFDDVDKIRDVGAGMVEKTYRQQRRLIELTTARKTGRILCNSSFSHEFIRRAYGLNAWLCPPGVNAEEFAPNANVSVKNQVICWGPLWPNKGLAFIVRSIGLIPQSYRPKVIFPWTRGSTSFQDELRKLAEHHSVSLEMPQGLDDAALLRRIWESKVCVYAPEMEPLGLVALEAMAAGLPVVGVREGGIRETVLEGVTGLLSDRDEKSFADNLLRLLTDEHLRGSISTAAVAYIRKEWTWDQAVNVCEAHLSSVSKNGQ